MLNLCRMISNWISLGCWCVGVFSYITTNDKIVLLILLSKEFGHRSGLAYPCPIWWNPLAWQQICGDTEAIFCVGTSFTRHQATERANLSKTSSCSGLKVESLTFISVGCLTQHGVARFVQKKVTRFFSRGIRGEIKVISFIISWENPCLLVLGGGFKICLFSPRNLGKISNLTSIFFRWVVQPPTRVALMRPKVWNYFRSYTCTWWSAWNEQVYCIIIYD